MSRTGLLHAAILLAGIAAPFVWPAHTTQIAVLWIMILFALTWDIMGGQMGYNSLGNILFFGLGMYVCAVAQIGMFYDVAEYTAAFGAIKVDFTETQYYGGLALGIVLAALGAMVAAALLSWILFGLRGPYFAIGTLGAAIAAAELTGAWSYVGGGGGISMPVFPGDPQDRSFFFYALCMAAAVGCYGFLRWLYGTRFALAINAIRDDEEKAEALGIRTKRYKAVAWCISAFFLGIAGALFGNMTGFIEPLEVAYPTLTFGVFMVAMTLLGGKGTLWGPVIGATLFYDVRAGVVADAKEYGMDIVIDDKLPRDLSDMTATLTKVKALKPDLLVVSGHTKGATTAARQISEMNVDVPLVAMTHCESADLVGKFGAKAEGILCPTQWAETLSYSDKLFGSAAEYDKLFRKTYPEYETVPYQAAQASAAVQVWKDAFERAQSFDTEKLRDALAATEMMTFYGPIDFGPAGNNIAKPMVLRQIQDGDYNVVAPSKFASHKLELDASK